MNNETSMVWIIVFITLYSVFLTILSIHLMIKLDEINYELEQYRQAERVWNTEVYRNPKIYEDDE